MKKVFWLLPIIIFLGLGIKSDFSLAQQKVEINFFYSAICPHCEKEKEFLKELKEKYPEIEIKEYEVIFNPKNKEIFKAISHLTPVLETNLKAKKEIRKIFEKLQQILWSDQ